jgi:hypothetical protein
LSAAAIEIAKVNAPKGAFLVGDTRTTSAYTA